MEARERALLVEREKGRDTKTVQGRGTAVWPRAGHHHHGWPAGQGAAAPEVLGGLPTQVPTKPKASEENVTTLNFNSLPSPLHLFIFLYFTPIE